MCESAKSTDEADKMVLWNMEADLRKHLYFCQTLNNDMINFKEMGEKNDLLPSLKLKLP